jgi:flagellar hook-associated protein 2
MGISLDGLSSGLDTTSLIAKLMQAEAQPQALLKSQVTTVGNKITAFQNLNSKLAALATLAGSAAKAGALEVYTATSSSTAVTAATSAGASTGELQVVVSALAQSQVGVSAAMATWPSPPTITIVGHSGTPVEITPASGSIDDVVSAINSSSAGVRASKVASGTDPITGDKLYRIQFSSIASGADSAFSVYQGSAADVAASTATNVLTAPGAAVIKTAQDAKVTLWAGTAAEQVIDSATNTFSDLLPGLSVTVSAVSTAPVTIGISRDTNQVSGLASKLVDTLNGIFSYISAQSTSASTAAAGGTTTVKSGVFGGDSTVRTVNDRVLTAATAPVNGHSPSEYGINITRDGTIVFDADKFTAALTADPTTVNAAISTIATRVAAAATDASDKYTGSITTKITGGQSQVKTLNSQIDAWDIRLASKQKTLESTYSSMEVMMNKLKSQQSNIMSQLAGLSTSTGN